jgi:photosystem II stability/assembly factor-like uncharacterized protein
MASLKFEGFLGDIPYLDSTGLPEQNSRHNRDCWFIDGKLRPIKEAADDGSISADAETIYRYRPCPKDATQQYWVTRDNAYNVAPSPIANDKYGRLYFARKKYATGDAIELPHFFDVKQLLNRSSNTALCSTAGENLGPYPAPSVTPYTLGVPSPREFSAALTGGFFALATSTDTNSWTFPDEYKNPEYSFLRVFRNGNTILAGGYNGTIIYSQDGGDTWATAYTPETAASFTIRSFAYDGSGWYIAGCENGKLLISSNGTSWELPAYSGEGQKVMDGHITAAAYDNGKFFLGSTAGFVKSSTGAVNGASPWEDVTAATALFRVTANNATTINPINDAAVANGNVYLVGGASTGLVVTNAGGNWGASTGHDLNGPIISINTSPAGGRFICATSDAVQERGAAWGSKIRVTTTNFPGAAFFLDNSGTWKNVRSAGYTYDNLIVIIGERGAYTRQQSTLNQNTWVGADKADLFGQTRLNDVLFTGLKTILVGGDKLSTTLAIQPRYYAVTFVDGYGAEGAPVLSTKLSTTPGGVFNIGWNPPTFRVDEDGVAVGSGGYTQNVYGTQVNDAAKAKFRIYRTASSGSSTEFLLVDTVTYVPGQTSYSYKDVKLDEALAEVMLSVDWIPPPPKLRGLVSLPGGVLAGFVDNTLWFSEPGQPQAWPIKYQRTVNAPIVGLSTFANSVLVTTIDRSFIATGIDPFNMALTELETDQSCVSADSVVDMGGYAIYATPRGLVKVSGQTPEWITKQLFTPVQWGQLDPASIKATLWEGRYLAFFSGTPTYAAGGVHSFSLVPGADVDGVAWYTQSANLVFTDSYNDQVYFIKDGAKKIWNGGENNLTCLWRSKMIQSPESLNFSWLQVQLAGEGDPVFGGTGVSPMGNSPSGNFAKVRLYSEEGYTPSVEVTIEATDHITRQTPFTLTTFDPTGAAIQTVTGIAYDATVRLPAGRRTRFHLVDVEANAKVLQVLVTQSSQELRST